MQALAGPVIVPGIAGAALTAKLRVAPTPQLFTAATVMLPVVKDPLKSTLILLLFSPLLIEAFVGTVQL